MAACSVIIRIFAPPNIKFQTMELTLNEMRALKRLAEAASDENKFTVCTNDVPQAKERWEILSDYLKSHKLGSEYIGNRWSFNLKGNATALKCRMDDLIKDEERHQKDASKMAWASWLSSFAAVVSALAALVALCSH